MENNLKSKNRIHAKHKGLHGGLVVTQAVYKTINMVASLGLSFTRAHVYRKRDSESRFHNSRDREINHKKNVRVPRAMLGIEYPFDYFENKLKMRLSCIYHHMKKHYDAERKLKMGNSYHISAGINCSF
jgi:hypothetical protein